MRVLASQQLNPMINPPDILKKILHKFEGDIKSNTRLKLCEDPEDYIWSYYGTVNVSKSKVYTVLKGKGRPEGSQYQQKKKQTIKPETMTSHSDIVNE